VTTNILIVNQHGENRGDEAAMRAMLAGFDERLADAHFTLLYQFRDRTLRPVLEQDVETFPIIWPLGDYVRLLAFTACKFLGFEPDSVLSPTLRGIIAAYREADLVVSAPGGPYFGDIYANHELLHWWFILLGSLYQKPLFLYATSAGPFRNILLKPIRKVLYRKFAKLVVREERSSAFIKQLLGEDTEVEVTADSAIQQSFDPVPRATYFGDRTVDFNNRLLVAVSLNDYQYPGESDPKALKSRYNATALVTLKHLVEKQGAYLLLLPQLYGKAHSDVGYLRSIASDLPEGSWEIVDDSLNSDAQRKIFAMCDIHLASRYHPAIFGNTANVPGCCIYYEHKALGFMEQLKLEQYAFDIRTVEAAVLCRTLDSIIERRDALQQHLQDEVPRLRAKSQRTTEIAIGLIKDA